MTHRLAVSWLPEDCSAHLAQRVKAAIGSHPQAFAVEAARHVSTAPLSVIHGSRYADGLTMILEAESEACLDAAYARVLDACNADGTCLPFAHTPIDDGVSGGAVILADPYIGYFPHEEPGPEGPFGPFVMALLTSGQAMPRAEYATPLEGDASDGLPAPGRRLLHANLHGLSASAGRPALHAYGLGGDHVVAAGGHAAFSTVMRAVLRRHLDWWQNHPAQIHLAAIEYREEGVLDATAMDHVAMRGRSAVLHDELARLYRAVFSRVEDFVSGLFQLQVRVDGAKVWLVMNAALHDAFVQCPGQFDLSWPDRVGRAYGTQPARAVNAGDDVEGWVLPRIVLHGEVVLTCDLPVDGLHQGTRGIVQALAYLPAGDAWTVEFLDQGMVIVVDVPVQHLEPCAAKQGGDVDGAATRRSPTLMQQSYLRMLGRQP